MTQIAGLLTTATEVSGAGEIFFPFGLVSLELVLGLCGMLVLARVRRAGRESRSRERRRRYAAAVATGTGLADAAAEAAGRQETREDLSAVLAGSEGTPFAGRDDLASGAEWSGLATILRRQMRSRRATRRAHATLLAGQLCIEGVTQSAGALLLDSDADVRRAAVRALGEQRTNAAAFALARGLRDGSGTPEWIVEQLARDWAVPALIVCAASPDFAAARPWLVEALGLAGVATAVPLLLKLTANGTEEERIRACRALGRLALRQSRPALVAALEDSSWRVRSQAAKALSPLEDPAAVPALAARLNDSAWWVRANCAAALRQSGATGLEALRAALHHTDRYARERAVEELALHDMALARATP